MCIVGPAASAIDQGFEVCVIADAGGSFQNYPDDYKVIEDLHAQEAS